MCFSKATGFETIYTLRCCLSTHIIHQRTGTRMDPHSAIPTGEIKKTILWECRRVLVNPGLLWNCGTILRNLDRGWGTSILRRDNWNFAWMLCNRCAQNTLTVTEVWLRNSSIFIIQPLLQRMTEPLFALPNRFLDLSTGNTRQGDSPNQNLVVQIQTCIVWLTDGNTVRG